jgi:hypothetical protein
MLALGLTLVVSVAAAAPRPAHAVERVASTYDEAACDPADGGECADEAMVELSAPALPTIIDCESPVIADMIGSCDLPTPMLPSLHVPTLRTGGNGATVVLRSGGGDETTVTPGASSLDGAIPLVATLVASSASAPVVAMTDTATKDVPRPRLDRPPRA